MVAMLEDVINIGTGQGAKALMRPAGGKTGTTNNYTDAWFMGFTPQLTAGVWVGFDDKAISLGRGETGARAALPIWTEFMQGAHAGLPVETFPNVESLAKEAAVRQVRVDTPDDAPEGAAEEPATPATPEDQPADPAAPAVAPTSTTTP
jgi:penicillin-binding protein 1A